LATRRAAAIFAAMTDRASQAARVVVRLAAILLFFGVAAASPALAQSAALAVQSSAPAQPAAAAPPPAPVTAAELQRLVDTLQDDAQRAVLVEQLRGLIRAQRGAAAPPAETPTTLAGQITQRTQAISEEVLAAAAVVVDVPRLAGWLAQQATDPVLRAFWLSVALKLVIIFGLAFAGEWIMRRVLLRPRRSMTSSQDHFLLRVSLMAARALLDALPILTFAGVAYIALPFIGARFATARFVTTLVGAYVTARIIAAIARIIWLPRLGPPLFHGFSEETRGYLYVWSKRFTYWAVYGYAVAEGAWWLGVPGGIYAFLLKGTALVLAVLAIVFVLQNRAAVAEWLRGRPPDAALPGVSTAAGGWRVLRNRLADTWHVLAIIYIAAIFLVYALRVEGGFIFVLRGTLLTLAVIIVARLVVNVIRQASRRGFAIGSDLKLKFPTLEQRANRYLPVLTMVLSALVYVFAVLAVLQAWNIDAFSWFTSDFGRHLTSGLLSIGTVVVIALMIWEVFSSAIERYLSAVDGNGVQVARSARARTLLPLLRTTMLVFILILVSLIVLSQIGVDIAPLLAGAGVVGLAIGFGSQTLVKDIITGLFMLIEDTLAVGDVVDVGGGHAGVVETISIRTIRLRDGAGTVHTVPFSAVTSVQNMTKDYSYYVANIGVSYREDTDEVVAVLREVGADLCADAAFRSFILEPLEVIGVDKFAESSVIIQVRFKTLPIKQWAVGREFNRRLKKAFDEHGIEMPFPHQTVYFGVDKKGAAPPIHVQLEGGATAPAAEEPPAAQEPSGPPVRTVKSA
jgi:moderate conductance mechanosensitive channel